VAGSGPIRTTSSRAIEGVLRPKVAGTIALANALRDEPLDVLVLFSSLSAIVGGVGRADYAAANAFLDAFAERWSRERPTRAIAIDWDGWEDVGMGARATRPASGAPRRIAAHEGVAVLRQILASPHQPQVAVSTRSLHAVIESSATASDIEEMAASRATPRAAHPRPPLATPFVAPRNELEEATARIWEQALGVAPIGVLDSFLELGGNSLTAIEVLARMRQVLEIGVSIDQLFTHPTIASLIAALVAQVAPDSVHAG
jgi:hypothetical protein